MMNSKLASFERPKLIIFDLYGTLIRFGIMNHPFRKALVWAREQGRRPHPDDARCIMTTNLAVAGILNNIGVFPPKPLLEAIETDIEEELSQLTLYDDVAPILYKIEKAGIPIAICSNLAKPYGRAIQDLLPDLTYHSHLSYEMGLIKPDIEMYQSIVRPLNLMPSQCLFIGDTYLADYDGPTKAGFKALHLVRNGSQDEQTISSLTDISCLLDS